GSSESMAVQIDNTNRVFCRKGKPVVSREIIQQGRGVVGRRLDCCGGCSVDVRTVALAGLESSVSNKGCSIFTVCQLCITKFTCFCIACFQCNTALRIDRDDFLAPICRYIECYVCGGSNRRRLAS